MTYEQASARGLTFARSDGDTLTYRDGVMHHFNAAIVTAITAARNREKFMREYLEYRRSAIAEGEKGADPRIRDRARPGCVARRRCWRSNLATQGIEVRRAEEPIKLGTRTIPAGAYIVSNAQPTARMIRNLLDPKTEQSAEFIKKQEERRKMRLNDQIYDITAWNLPMLFDVETVTSPSAISVKSTPVSRRSTTRRCRRVRCPQRKVGYLMPWGSAAVALSADAMKQGIRIRSVGGAFTQNGRRYPIGTAFIRNAGNPADLNAKLAALVAKHGAELVPIDSTWVDDGTSLGSNDVAALKTPKVLLVWDTPTATLSAGWTRYVLERRFGVGRHRRAHQLARPRRLQRLRRHRPAVGKLRRRDQRSACSIASRTGCAPAARSSRSRKHRAGRPARTSACSTRRRCLKMAGRMCRRRPAGAAVRRVAAGATAPKPGEFDYDKAIQPDRERPASQPGAILRVTLDTNHWLTAGNDGETQVMIEGNRVFAPLKLNSGRNVGVYATKDKLIASGLIWPDAQDILVQKAFLMHQPFGQGHVIAFAEEPNYRAFTESTMLLFMNAVMLGPGY